MRCARVRIPLLQSLLPWRYLLLEVKCDQSVLLMMCIFMFSYDVLLLLLERIRRRPLVFLILCCSYHSIFNRDVLIIIAMI